MRQSKCAYRESTIQHRVAPGGGPRFRAVIRMMPTVLRYVKWRSVVPGYGGGARNVQSRWLRKMKKPVSTSAAALEGTAGHPATRENTAISPSDKA